MHNVMSTAIEWRQGYWLRDQSAAQCNRLRLCMHWVQRLYQVTSFSYCYEV